MRLKFIVACVATLIFGCSSSQDPVHTHEPSDPQETYEPTDFETVDPDNS